MSHAIKGSSGLRLKTFFCGRFKYRKEKHIIHWLICIMKLKYMHTCHKLWTKICETRQNFKGDLTKFCEIFLNITGASQIQSKVFFFSCQKLVKTKTKCDLHLFLHKICCNLK